ncbi:hypothetical protein N7528_009203 [Penicillium herquei]|nr:hypothetical protein N7528_009203 [Penicillium herquei]
MKRSRGYQIRTVESRAGRDDTNVTTPSDSQQDDTAYELTDLENAPNARKRLRLDDNGTLASPHLRMKPSMKRSRGHQNRKLDGKSCRDDNAYETDSIEVEDSPHARKRLRLDENHALEPGDLGNGRRFYDDPVDEGGINLSDIPDDFGKAPSTVERRERIETRWEWYCVSQMRSRPNEWKWREVEEALRQASNNDMYRFLRWCLLLEQGKDGRHTKGIQKASTLETDWKNLRLYYQKLTKITINDDDGSEIRKAGGMKWLVHEFNLDTQPGKKTPVYIEDIAPFNETILSTQEKRFHLGFQRIQVCLFNSLGIFTVHRKSAMLSLQFRDLQVSLQKDPRGGPPIPLIELTPEGVKNSSV